VAKDAKKRSVDGTSMYPTVDERAANGKDRRSSAPRSSLGEWKPGADRPNPVSLIEEQNNNRVQSLVPVRRGRMSVSAFTFFRGAARIMSSDLSTTPVSGLNAQLCGDAHLSNFGAFASAERALIFDVNDFDETLPGPWEWDLKRLATSFVVAGRDNDMTADQCRTAAQLSAAGYQTAMAKFAEMSDQAIWYATLPVDKLKDFIKGTESQKQVKKKQVKKIDKFQKKAESKTSLQALSKLTEKVNGRYRIKSDPPVLVPLRDLSNDDSPGELREMVDGAFSSYRLSLPDDRRVLLDRFEQVDIAVKVVGVGSVGTRCLIMLLQGRDGQDPLFLQIKQATESVLEDHLPASAYGNPGERVVWGQRLMQASSDIFLGWAEPTMGHHYYWRQLKDWKGSVDIDTAPSKELLDYAALCGWTLAHSHARSGDPIALSAYAGSGSVFVKAISDFAESYADQNDRDYALFKAAIDDGTLAIELDV
jgi:uncharacterized protein (DUF2252 family)